MWLESNLGFQGQVEEKEHGITESVRQIMENQAIRLIMANRHADVIEYIFEFLTRY